MKDHQVNCEIRILPGSRNCTCGAVDESYPTVTTNTSTDVTPGATALRAAPKAKPALAKPAAVATGGNAVSAVFVNPHVLEVTAPTDPSVVVVNGKVYALLSKA